MCGHPSRTTTGYDFLNISHLCIIKYGFTFFMFTAFLLSHYHIPVMFLCYLIVYNMPFSVIYRVLSVPSIWYDCIHIRHVLTIT